MAPALQFACRHFRLVHGTTVPQLFDMQQGFNYAWSVTQDGT